MDKLLIVDGHNLHFQMFYGMPARIKNRDGVGIWAVIGFVGAMIRMINSLAPTHILVVFDGEGGSFRSAVNPDYKANRPDYEEVSEDENPFSQLPYVYKALECMGVKYFETDGCEADDLIASYAIRFGKRMKVTICSFDSDYFQLINENVNILRYRGDCSMTCDTEYIIKSFGIHPSQYADYKSLAGDTADNIKGARLVGKKTAASLVSRFGSLESVLSCIGEIERDGVRKSLIESADKLRDNYRIIKLSDSVDLPLDTESLLNRTDGRKTMEILSSIGL